MGIAVLTSLALIMLFSIPLITGLFARRMGRSFIRWFFIGMILPVISVFIIFFLPDLSESETGPGV